MTGRFDPEQPIRQETYLKALSTYITEVSIYYGHFPSHRVSASLADPVGDKRFVEIIRTEEKGSDVNLAVHLLNGAWLNRFDCALVVSNDSDLAETMQSGGLTLGAAVIADQFFVNTVSWKPKHT